MTREGSRWFQRIVTGMGAAVFRIHPCVIGSGRISVSSRLSQVVEFSLCENSGRAQRPAPGVAGTVRYCDEMEMLPRSQGPRFLGFLRL